MGKWVNEIHNNYIDALVYLLKGKHSYIVNYASNNLGYPLPGSTVEILEKSKHDEPPGTI